METKVAVLVLLSLVAVSFATPLDDYVNAPDPTYQWETVNSVRGLNFTAYNIKLTSQTWMTPQQVSISVWTHWLQICVPDEVRKFYDKLPSHTTPFSTFNEIYRLRFPHLGVEYTIGNISKAIRNCSLALSE